MEIKYFDSCPSTQNFLVETLRKNGFKKAYALVANKQSAAIGSRNNSWQSLEGNLFLSFCDEIKNYQVPKENFSLYFSSILVEVLRIFGSQAFVKWPNDIYLEDKKIGGLMTNLLKESFVCGLGLNLQSSEKYQALDIKISREELLQAFFEKIASKPSWEEVFANFAKDFSKSQKLSATLGKEKLSLKNAKLNADASITLNEENFPCKR